MLGVNQPWNDEGNYAELSEDQNQLTKENALKTTEIKNSVDEIEKSL